MTEPKPKRPWWRKKRWWAAIGLWLLILYPTSGGPVVGMTSRGLLPAWLNRFFVDFYAPVRAITLEDDSRVKPEFAWWFAYIDLFRAPPAPSPPPYLPPSPKPIYIPDPDINRTHWTPPPADGGINRTHWTPPKKAEQ